MMKPNIFDYLDYRIYLADYYKYQKSVNPIFSYRWFAQKAGYNSSGYYSNVVNGVHGMSEVYCNKFSIALGLSSLEANFFELLVKYQDSNTKFDKQSYLDQLVLFRSSRFYRLEKSQYKYYTKWYIVAIHQALNIFSFDGALNDLGQFIHPPIKRGEVSQAIDVLKELELIAKDEEGFWRPIEALSVGGKEVGVLAIRSFQKQMMQKAMESLDLINPKHRQVISNTFTINEKGFDEVKDMVAILQHKISEAVKNSDQHDRLYQFNVQLFPLSGVKHV